MTAFNGQHEIACCGYIAAHNMHLSAQMIAHHALGVANALGGIEREACWQGMENRLSLTGRLGGCCFKDPMQIAISHRMAANLNPGLVMLRIEPTAGHIDDHAFHLHASHALSCIHCHTNCLFGLIHIHNCASFNAARALMANAQNAAFMGAPAQGLGGFHRNETGDQADDF
jgi:hypothetical protein